LRQNLSGRLLECDRFAFCPGHGKFIFSERLARSSADICHHDMASHHDSTKQGRQMEHVGYEYIVILNDLQLRQGVVRDAERSHGAGMDLRPASASAVD
jgi:hypothetical protein